MGSWLDPRWPVNQGHFRAAAGPGLAAPGRRQSLHRRSVARRYRAGGFGFDQAHPTVSGWHKEIHFQSLLIPKVIEFPPTASNCRG